MIISTEPYRGYKLQLLDTFKVRICHHAEVGPLCTEASMKDAKAQVDEWLDHSSH
jgi:hypothetical protein